uniref:U29-theraphotoxin-Cg1a n=1 Tax=Chilobrachys guangxiensis TaxID=278060 RepID=JZT59_CHIGU|nr:RecName: Full=U29-theraphotoxin-Cg1a; Short=U29-TRTX-Cg1a; AltName: Full=Jingzhaotoxin-59; Short=JZTX-59; Flags: Precursor [Chilobrachys guangxiensis]ABY71730.1 cystine knot toxin [Chilobrachys guangxiensis]
MRYQTVFWILLIALCTVNPAKIQDVASYGGTVRLTDSGRAKCSRKTWPCETSEDCCDKNCSDTFWTCQLGYGCSRVCV